MLKRHLFNGPKRSVNPIPHHIFITAYRVNENITGKTLDGKIFDSSIQRGTPASFPVNGVIKGWQEALQLMAEGAKWELFIPSDLAYGAAGSGGTIKPHATLLFEIELISVK